MSNVNMLSWDYFRVKHPNDGWRKAFEDLCKSLFARRINLKKCNLVEYHNQKGIEVEPVEINGDYYSFQSKFSEKDQVLWSKFKTSAKKTIEEYEKLSHVIYYTNGTSSRKNKTRNEIEKINDDNEIKTFWVYGKQILELIEEPQNYDLKMKCFGGGQNLNITLPITENKKKSLSALKYQYQIVDFCGRVEELKCLKDFLDCEELVQWWIIGGVGGSGKSRLALEFCKQNLGTEWHCGFISSIENLNLEEWNPEKNHIIVCDYVFNKENAVARLIDNAIKLKQNKTLSFKIRILLLERDANSIIDSMKKIETIGPRIDSYLYKENPLLLSEFEEKDLDNMLKEVSSFFELSEDKYPLLKESIKKDKPSRAFLMASLFCLYHYNQENIDTPKDFKEIILELINRERLQWQIDKTHEDLLVIATMVGGIDLSHKELLEENTMKFLRNYDSKIYTKIFGGIPTTILEPLSHDLISELYVLDYLKPLNSLNNDSFSNTITLALGVDNGKELISFFTRAANDYPNHPTLNNLLQQFSNTKPKFTVWLLIITNVIDKIDSSIELKTDCFSRIITGLNGDPKIYFEFRNILDHLFIRLLAHISSSESLNKWVVEYKIIKPTEEALTNEKNTKTQDLDVRIDKNLLLKPLNYCEDIIVAFSNLEKSHKQKISSHTIIEVYLHFFLHKLHSRKADLKEINIMLVEINEVMNNNLTPGVALIFRNVIAGLIQWNYINKNKETVLQLTYDILDMLEKRSPSENLADVYNVAIGVISRIIFTFDERKNILDRFIKTFGEDFETTDSLAKNFIGMSICLMSPKFTSIEEYKYSEGLIYKSKDLLTKYKTPENAINFTMAIVQLTRYRGEYSTEEEKGRLLDECISTAKQYTFLSDEILQNVVREISSQYNEKIKKDLSTATADDLLDKIIDLIIELKGVIKEDKKIHLGGFFGITIECLLEDNKFDKAKIIIDKMALLSKFHFVEFHFQMRSNIDTKLFKLWNKANKENNISISASLVNFAEYYSINLPNGKMNKGIIKHMIGENER